MKRLLLIVVALLVAAGAWLGTSDNVRRSVELKAVEKIGEVAVKRMEAAGVEPGSAAADFIRIPIVARQINDFIYQASGVGNTNLIRTPAGHVIFDTGLATQVPKQIKALREAVPEGAISHIIVSHSHADHIGGVKFWREEGTEIVAHAEFSEEQRYLTELQPYFWSRNRTLFPFMPEKPPEIGLIAYGGIVPDRIVANGAPYQFTHGGVEFEVIAAPGAEGSDNLLLWLPQEKILFSGDFFGPLFPQFPNIFTMRGEKIRKPIEYVNSLNMVIALDPQIIVPSHLEPITSPALIMAGLVKMRDATKYVHDQTVIGMNAGKTIEELMTSISLPEELTLTEEHGKVSWAVKSIWEYYATWFHFDRTTELYAVPQQQVYGDLLELAGAEQLIDRARKYSASGNHLQAMHLLEIVIGAESGNKDARRLQLKVLQALVQQAESSSKNSYEIYWLRYQIRLAQSALSEVSKTFSVEQQ